MVEVPFAPDHAVSVSISSTANCHAREGSWIVGFVNERGARLLVAQRCRPTHRQGVFRAGFRPIFPHPAMRVAAVVGVLRKFDAAIAG
ncbi:MAG: hypothetical protein HOQ44_03780 [Nocardia sp.]|nr:hypothetical protein [Nocardia sp.]